MGMDVQLTKYGTHNMLQAPQCNHPIYIVLDLNNNKQNWSRVTFLQVKKQHVHSITIGTYSVLHVCP